MRFNPNQKIKIVTPSSFEPSELDKIMTLQWWNMQSGFWFFSKRPDPV